MRLVPVQSHAYIAVMRMKPVVALLALVVFPQDVLLSGAPVCARSHPDGSAVAAVHQAHGTSRTPETPGGGHRHCLTAPSSRGGTHAPATCAAMAGCTTAPAVARALVAPVRPPDPAEPPVAPVPALHTFHLPPVTPPPKA